MTDAISLLEGALKIYGPSTQEEQICDYLVAQMRARGMRAFRDESGSAVGIIDPPSAALQVEGQPPMEIVLLGHLDTVPGFIDVRHDGDKLYGRGAVDARGPLCAFIEAAVFAGARAGWRTVVVGAVEEEAATSKGARFAATQYHPAYCVIGEPSGWDRITLGYKGRLLVHYRSVRAMSHTAGQARAVAEAAVAFWNHVGAVAARYNQGKPKAFDQLDPSLRRFRTGDDPFIDSVEMTIGIRVPVGVTVSDLKSQLAALACDAELAFASEEEAHRADKNTPLVRAFLAAMRGHGAAPGFTVKTGTSDMNVVAPVWQCPILAYGPGDSNLDHTPHEHIDLGEYTRAIAVLSDVLRALTMPG
jgi:[amino group carrier protein]-lysine/ornithine hydrolase